ncbi:hypothetical protein LAZ67_2001822 [Cordylochernes scorpioides]|uniref:Uncharacterized protein n=1 Tax=Cordylochernes scorpioides TaxID=51811 RepID=A0ABY6K1N8_9ARAC|nr:hypothetical protein LAZ67_2001822 [Cordylochernes scorpioides]
MQALPIQVKIKLLGIEAPSLKSIPHYDIRISVNKIGQVPTCSRLMTISDGRFNKSRSWRKLPANKAKETCWQVWPPTSPALFPKSPDWLGARGMLYETNTNQRLAEVLKKFGIRPIFVGSRSIGQIVRHPITKSQVKTEPSDQQNAVYSLSCQQCTASYVGETGRTVGTRVKEHIRNKLVAIFSSFHSLSLNEVEAAAWNSFRNVCKNFLGSVKVENYQDIVNDLLLFYKALGCNMSLKIHFLHSHLDFFPDNLGAFSDENGESTEKRYQGKWSPGMLADYCWTLKRDVPHTQAKYRRKSTDIEVKYLTKLKDLVNERRVGFQGDGWMEWSTREVCRLGHRPLHSHPHFLPLILPNGTYSRYVGLVICQPFNALV